MRRGGIGLWGDVATRGRVRLQWSCEAGRDRLGWLACVMEKAALVELMLSGPRERARQQPPWREREERNAKRFRALSCSGRCDDSLRVKTTIVIRVTIETDTLGESRILATSSI